MCTNDIKLGSVTDVHGWLVWVCDQADRRKGRVLCQGVGGSLVIIIDFIIPSKYRSIPMCTV